MKLTRSPLPKAQRRLCTRTECTQKLKPSVHIPYPVRCSNPLSLENTTLADYQKSAIEIGAIAELQKDLNVYMLHKISVSNSTEEHPFISVQDQFSVICILYALSSTLIHIISFA